MKQPKPTDFALLREKTGLTVEEIAERFHINKRTVYRWEKGDTKPGKSILLMLQQPVKKSGVILPFKRPSFTFIDLFAGIGGMRMAFEAIGGDCVFTSEWDLSCRKTYLANFSCNDHQVAGDITKIHVKDIPPHDVLLAGFPCQPFSIAGVSKKNALGRSHGFDDPTQGTLFFDIVRIVRHHRPSAFLLENVKNLMSHDKGNTFKIICDRLENELGYSICYKIIDARCFVPQHRQRIFIAGFRNKCDFSFDRVEIPPVSVWPKLSAVLHPENGSEKEEPRFTSGPRARVLGKYTLSDHLWRYLQDYADKHRAKGNGFGFGLVGPNDISRTLSARYYKDGSEILVKQRGKNPRRLTPRECARLLGFDGPGRRKFEIPVSDTQAYKQFGNAVVVPVVLAIARAMQPFVERINTSTDIERHRRSQLELLDDNYMEKMRTGTRG